MASLFIFDFDGCITDWNDQLPRDRANKIAHAMNFLFQYGAIEIISMANRAHINAMVQQTKSKSLIKVFDQIPWSQWSTIEKREHLTQINPSRRESEKKQRAMIMEIMKSEQWLTDLDCIYAYKKTHALNAISKNYGIAPEHIYFFDDNMYNIIFARSNGFKALLVNNHPAMFELNLRTQLGMVQKEIMLRQKIKKTKTLNLDL